MTTISKIVRIGTGPYGNVFCKIKFIDGKLSITGVEGPMRNGDAKGSCGQIIIMDEWNISTYAPGWSPELEAEFRTVWGAWHLNDMRAGSPAQHAYLDANPIGNATDHYTRACAALRSAGLNPDPNYLHKGKPYAYGSAWLRDDVPESILTFLQSLPDTDLTPAWV
jgi:hypothetical protein